MHTWVVSQLCSQHDVMYVSELLKYTCSVCYIIYQVVVCACVQVIKIVACWTISFRHHILMVHSYNINTLTLVLCMFSFQQPYSFYNINTMLLWYSCVSLCHVQFDILPIWCRDLCRWDYRPGWIDHKSMFSWADTTASGIIITWHIVISYTTSKSGELFSSFM